MRMIKFLVVILVLFSSVISGFCQDTRPVKDSLIQRGVSLNGKALNAKLGAIIETDTMIYYIEELQTWPPNRYNRIITVNADLYLTAATVFIQPNDTVPVRGGITARDSTEFEKYKYQRILKNVTYK